MAKTIGYVHGNLTNGAPTIFEDDDGYIVLTRATAQQRVREYKKKCELAIDQARVELRQARSEIKRLCEVMKAYPPAAQRSSRQHREYFLLEQRVREQAAFRNHYLENIKYFIGLKATYRVFRIQTL